MKYSLFVGLVVALFFEACTKTGQQVKVPASVVGRWTLAKQRIETFMPADSLISDTTFTQFAGSPYCLYNADGTGVLHLISSAGTDVNFKYTISGNIETDTISQMPVKVIISLTYNTLVRHSAATTNGVQIIEDDTLVR